MSCEFAVSSDVFSAAPSFLFWLQAFKSFRVQYEMRKKQIESLLQPVHKDGKLSVDQAVVKQSWDHVSVRVCALPNVIQEFVHPKSTILSLFIHFLMECKWRCLALCSCHLLYNEN